jgi:hypothetical protein
MNARTKLVLALAALVVVALGFVYPLVLIARKRMAAEDAASIQREVRAGDEIYFSSVRDGRVYDAAELEAVRAGVRKFAEAEVAIYRGRPTATSAPSSTPTPIPTVDAWTAARDAALKAAAKAEAKP